MTLPEYGRNIQNMVDYCVTIQDREERKRCANTIINIMGNHVPALRDSKRTLSISSGIIWRSWPILSSI